MKLTEEQSRLNILLKSKKVAKIFRRKRHEVVIEFEDGARLFVNTIDERKSPIEISVTG